MCQVIPFPQDRPRSKSHSRQTVNTPFFAWYIEGFPMTRSPITSEVGRATSEDWKAFWRASTRDQIRLYLARNPLHLQRGTDMNAKETWQLIHKERAAMADTLEALSPEQWAADSWCTSWSVQDTAGHILAAAEQTPLNFYKE